MTGRRGLRATGIALLATTLISAGTTVSVVGAAASGETLTDANVSNREIYFTSDENGCGLSSLWEMCVYYQHGLAAVTRVVVDAEDDSHPDGSLRMATPNAKDRLHLTYTLDGRYSSGPAFADLERGGYEVKVLQGRAPSFTIVVDCRQETGGVAYTYAGPLPEPGTGWQDVDVVQDGQAMWRGPGTGGGAEPRTLDALQAECPDGVVISHALTLASVGADTRVDAVRLYERDTNFWVPPLLRIKGHLGFMRIPPPQPQVERIRAYELAETYLGTGRPWGYQETTGDGWVYPARTRRQPPRAAVFATQSSFRTVAVAGPLANAVRGPLVLSRVHSLDASAKSTLDVVRPGSRVFLVGNTTQLSRGLAAAVRDRGYEPVRVSGRNDYATAVKVARLIDRRRPEATRRTVLVTSGRHLADTLPVPAAAGSRHGAVLLTRGSRMPRVTHRYLASHRPASVFAVGRAAASAMPGLRKDRKLVGNGRHATALEVARRLFPQPRSAGFARGDDPLGALVAGPYAGRQQGPVLLLRGDVVPRAVRRYVARHRESMHGSFLVAHADAVSDETFADLLGRLALEPWHASDP